MSDIRCCSRDFIMAFIDIYKSFPCLWKVKSREYNDRNKKNKAYDVLVEKFREVDICATRDTVTKKINSLRSTYRKELMKVMRSDQNGEDYRPTLWYYDLLDFLTDQDLPRDSKRTLADSNSSYTESKWEFSNPVMDSDRIDDESSALLGQSNNSSEYDYRRAYPTVTEVSKGTKRSASEEGLSNSKVIQLVAEKLKRNNDDVIYDRNDSFGKYVAEELNSMPCDMVPYVKKIINLAIFEGNMKTLNVTSSIKTNANQQSLRQCAPGGSSSSTELASEQTK